MVFVNAEDLLIDFWDGIDCDSSETLGTLSDSREIEDSLSFLRVASTTTSMFLIT